MVEIQEISAPFEFRTDFPVPINAVKLQVEGNKGNETLLSPASPTDNKALEQAKKILSTKAKKREIPWSYFWNLSESMTEVKHIYAMTCHRSQGSTFQNVIVNKKDIHMNPLFYTALTRASERLYILL